MKLSTEVLHKLNLGVIYLLLEPDKSAIRYVGQTTRNPRERFTAHMSKRQTIHMGNWVRSLKRKGQKPRMLIYKIVPTRELDNVEIETMAWFRRCGCNLVNYLDGGGSLSKADKQKIAVRQQGEGNSHAKLTSQQVLALYNDYAFSNASQKQLAGKYRCDVNVVNGILSGKRWGHLWYEIPKSLRQAIEDKKNARNTKGQAKLSNSTCVAIYNAYLSERYSVAALSREYSRAERTICSLLKGETYKDVYSALPEETKAAILNRLANWRQRAGRPRKYDYTKFRTK